MHKTKTKGEVVAAWCEATTVHGVADLYRGKQYSCGELLFWICVVSSAFAMATWQIRGVVQSYTGGNGYTTNIYFKRQPSISYPNIVLCNVNRATETAVKELNISSAALELFFAHLYSNTIFGLMPNSTSDPETWLYHELEWNKFLLQSPANAVYADRPDLLMDKLAHKCENMLMYLKNGMDGKGALVGPQCCANTVPVKNTYGRCFNIKLDGVKTFFAGPEFGLRLIGSVQSDEYMSDVFYNYNIAQGFIAFMTANPYEPVPSRPILIRKGSHTMVEVWQQTHKFNPPGQFEIFNLPCVRNLQFKALKGLYTADACVYDCTIYEVWQQCNCTPVNVEIQNKSQSLPYCGYNRACIYAAMLSKPSVACMFSCSMPCETRMTYTTAVTSYDMPSNKSKYKFVEFLRSSKIPINITGDPGDMILVDVFYSQMGQMIVETVETTPIFSVVSNIGGQLGLWMGASMVSIVQAVHYFITMLRAKFHRPKVAVAIEEK